MKMLRKITDWRKLLSSKENVSDGVYIKPTVYRLHINYKQTSTQILFRKCSEK